MTIINRIVQREVGLIPDPSQAPGYRGLILFTRDKTSYHIMSDSTNSELLFRLIPIHDHSQLMNHNKNHEDIQWLHRCYLAEIF
jgi:hypothetical protein